MAFSLNLVITLQGIVAILAISALARPSPLIPNPTLLDRNSSLLNRLKLVVQEGEEGSSPCWDSLFELQSCTGEVVLFFLNGETYLGPGCCSAIRTIEHHCWPSMLGTLGYTSEEGDILHGYCDEATTIPHHPSSPPIKN